MNTSVKLKQTTTMRRPTTEELAVIADRVATKLEQVATTDETYVPSKQDMADFAVLFRSFADHLDDEMSLVLG